MNISDLYFSEPIVGSQVYDVVFVVVSAPGNSVRRQDIRSTWAKGAWKLKFPVIFLIGESGSNEETLTGEQLVNGDLLRIRVKESYMNLTLKTAALVNYFNSETLNSLKAKYIVKVSAL